MGLPKKLTDMQSIAYVNGWSKAVNGDKEKLLVGAVRDAVKRSAYMLGK